MLNRFVYIVFLLVSTPCILLAKTGGRQTHAIVLHYGLAFVKPLSNIADTTKINKLAAKPDTKVKELPKPKRLPKPEKVDVADVKKVKAKRERRPDGMDRPPEIPRRNDN